MQEAEVIWIDDFVNLKRTTPRDKPDLSEAITGSAIWHGPGRSESDRPRPPSYHVLVDGTLYPIEFINYKWHFIEWDDSDEYTGYWSTPSKLINEGELGLGWLARTIEPTTPTVLQTTRRKAESSGTQPEEPLKEESDEEGDLMDKDPVQTETLAEDLYGRSTLTEIAEEIDPSEDRTHYLPTFVPPPNTMRPISVNPIMARSSRAGPEATSIGATSTVDVGKLVNNAIKVDGSLKGKVPESFNGDRTKTQKFMNAFDLFWMNNEDNSHMKNPYKRCTYFLGLLDGPKVEDWVINQTETLREKTNRSNNPIDKNKEVLWDELKDDFVNAYAHTGRIEQARIELGKLEMEGDLIDEYVAKFENLLKKAEIPRKEVGAIQKFKDGLRKGVLSKILQRDTWPETIDEWQENARREVRRMAVVKESLGDRGNYHLSSKQAKWSSMSQHFQPNKKRNEAVAMEIDAAKFTQNPRREEENAQLRKEGRCFKCKKQGHMKKACPDWAEESKGKPPPYQPKARSVNVSGPSTMEPNDENPPKELQDMKQLARNIHTLDDQETDELLQLVMDGEDF
jgi:hypothetical protein